MFWPLLYLWINLISPFFDPVEKLIKIEKNLYCDETEVSNLDYKEYTWWISLAFGKDSEMNLRVLPGEIFIDSAARIKQIKPSTYFNDDNYIHHPVVYVTYEQAMNYCQWRSDRYMERTLYLYKPMGYDTVKNKPIYFTLKNYIDYLPKTQKVSAYIFRLPTPEEWHKIANHKKTKKEFTKEYSSKKNPNWHRVYNLFGNVSEMTSVKGLSMGGSYADYSEEDPPTNYEFPYDGPSDKVGFRCVCTIEEMTGGGKSIESGVMD